MRSTTCGPWALALCAAALGAAPAAGRAQSLIQQERRLMELHSLLLDLPPVQAPAALAPGTLDAALEVWRSRWEAVAEVDAYPGRLTHAGIRLGWLAGG